MLIGLDGNEANVKNRVGSNVYAFEILCQLYKLATSYQLPATRIKFKIYLSSNPLPDLPKEKLGWEYKILKPKFFWTQWRLPLELCLTKDRPDVFFTPGHYAPRFCPVPSVISIMDLAFLKYPKSFRQKDLHQLVNWTAYSVKKAAHIFTISQYTKKDIVRFYKVPEDKITVTYPGISKSKKQKVKSKITIQNLKRRYKIYSDYLIYIGTLQPRKNLTKLIEAFSALSANSAFSAITLVIIGKKGWMYDEIFKLVHRTDLCKRVVFTGYIKEEEKQVLLKSAKAFVLPSLYEGFGIPVVEAMAAGVPVVISKVSSLPEIGGKAAIYIKNPKSVTSIAEALIRVLKLTKDQRKKLIALGLKQSKKFSWQRAGEKTLEVLKKIGRKNENQR